MITGIDSETQSLAGSSVSLRHANLRLVFNEIYKRRSATTLELAQTLNLSIPTVTSCLNRFIGNDFVHISKDAVYTGGRKAKVYDFNALGRIAIGVKLLKESAEIVATDLYGNVLEESVFDRPFEDDEAYYAAFGRWVNSFISALPYESDVILGVCIALQGLVSKDGESIYYSAALKSSGIRRMTFQSHIDARVHVMHDLDAAAFFEALTRPDMENAFYLILNKNFGGVTIFNHSVREALNTSSGTIEHMCLDPEGKECYCGGKGCVETFCSVDSLEEKIEPLSLTEFFSAVHSGDEESMSIWMEYLGYLALTINNLRMIMNIDILIGGLLLQFMNERDLEILEDMVNRTYPFKGIGPAVIKVSSHADDAIKLGAAMSLIEKVLMEA